MKIATNCLEKYPRLAEFISLYNNRDPSLVSWEDKVNDKLTLVDVSPDKITWDFEVLQCHCNLFGNLSGGCVATLVDVCSSLAILAGQGNIQWNQVGISTDLSVNYMRGVSPGQTIRIECQVYRVGKKIANTHTVIYDSKGNRCYSGGHSKFSIDSKL